MLTRKRFALVFPTIVLSAFALFSSACNKRFSIASPSKPVNMKIRYATLEFKADVKLYEERIAANLLDKARIVRDKIVYRLMAEIDGLYGEYTEKLYTGKGIVGVGGDSLSLGLTAAATIAAHPPTKTIFSALGTAITGVNLSVDKNFFAQQTFQAIGIAMQTRRDKAREVIIGGLGESVDHYSLEAAERDLVAYFYAGTLPGGLQELQETAGAAAKAQSERTLIH